MTSDYDLSGDFGDQLSLDPEVPLGGWMFRHPDRHELAVVLGVANDRRRTVTYRAAGEEQQLALVDFMAHHKRCRLDGSFI